MLALHVGKTTEEDPSRKQTQGPQRARCLGVPCKERNQCLIKERPDP